MDGRRRRTRRMGRPGGGQRCSAKPTPGHPSPAATDPPWLTHDSRRRRPHNPPSLAPTRRTPIPPLPAQPATARDCDAALLRACDRDRRPSASIPSDYTRSHTTALHRSPATKYASPTSTPPARMTHRPGSLPSPPPPPRQPPSLSVTHPSPPRGPPPQPRPKAYKVDEQRVLLRARGPPRRGQVGQQRLEACASRRVRSEGGGHRSR